MTSTKWQKDGICQMRSADLEALTEFDSVAQKLIRHSTCQCDTGDRSPHRPDKLGSRHRTGTVQSGVDRGNEKPAPEISTKATEFTFEPLQLCASLGTEPSTKIIDGWYTEFYAASL